MRLSILQEDTSILFQVTWSFIYSFLPTERQTNSPCLRALFNWRWFPDLITYNLHLQKNISDTLIQIFVAAACWENLRMKSCKMKDASPRWFGCSENLSTKFIALQMASMLWHRIKVCWQDSSLLSSLSEQHGKRFLDIMSGRDCMTDNCHSSIGVVLEFYVLEVWYFVFLVQHFQTDLAKSNKNQARKLLSIYRVHDHLWIVLILEPIIICLESDVCDQELPVGGKD